VPAPTPINPVLPVEVAAPMAPAAPAALAESRPSPRVAAATATANGGIAPALRRSLALTDPAAWLPSMTAFLCGAAASGHLSDGPGLLAGTLAGSDGPTMVTRTLAGVVLAGPVLGGFARVVNNWSDRSATPFAPAAMAKARTEAKPEWAIPNEPLAAPQVMMTGTVLLALGVLLAFVFGGVVTPLAGGGILLGLAYSLRPLRLKRNGWLGNGAVALACVGLSWLAGTVALAENRPHPVGAILAALFAIGAHGILTPHHFGTIARDRAGGIRTLPVLLGAHGAATYASTLMNVVQLVALMLAAVQGHPLVAGVLTLLLVGQWLWQRAWLAHPETQARWSPATIIRLLYLAAMLVAAFGVAAPAALR